MSDHEFHPNYWRSRTGTLNAYALSKGAQGFVTSDQLKALFVEGGGLCHWCGVEMRVGGANNTKTAKPLMTFDHVERIADGGTNTIDNLVCACQPCNQGRHPMAGLPSDPAGCVTKSQP